MNAVLFGAGASYGSQAFGVPPMGARLFDELRRFNPPGWGQVDPKLAKVFQKDFEHGMTQLAQQNSHAMPVLQRAMAAYFFRFQPQTSSLYFRLAQLIRTSG